MKKRFLTASAILLGLPVAVGTYLYFSTTTPYPKQLHFAHQQGPVNIHWDKQGVPHIEALKSDEDAFFALGYVHAHDRLWQMDFQRHVASGRLSELFGEATLEKDKFLRTFGFYRASEQSWNALDNETKNRVQAYTQGVNAFIQEKKYPLQMRILRYQPEAWTVIDSLCWEKMMAFNLQNTWKLKLSNARLIALLGEAHYRELYPNYPSWAPIIVPSKSLNPTLLQEKLPIKATHSEAIPSTHFLDTQTAALEKFLQFADLPGKGSNSWVISGKHTTTGKPLLANDPHLGLQAPAVWYLVDLKGPNFHVLGASIPGLPGVIIGRNDRIAWGLTNINPDTQDIYIEPDTTPLSVRHEKIKIKGKATLDYPIYESEHGPIISDIVEGLKNKPLLSLKWTALLPQDTTISALIKLNYAKDWESFRQALKDFTVPSQNFVYADIEGNIGYSASGIIPIREGWTGEFPVLGNGQFEWNGFIPFDELPTLYNPDDGIIVTANNKVVDDNYKYALTFRWQDPGLRAARILQLLNEKNQLSVEDVKHIQLDTRSNGWYLLKDSLLATPVKAGSESADMLTRLAAWTGDATLDSIAQSHFAKWFQALSEMPKTKIPFLAQINNPIFIQTQLQTNGFYCDGNASALLEKTLKTVAEQHTSKTWESLHIAKMEDVGLGTVKVIKWIFNRQIATPGDLHSINVGTYDMQFTQTDGPSYRQIIDFSALNDSLFIQPLGQSGNPFHRHYDDLMLPWRNGEYLKLTESPNE